MFPIGYSLRVDIEDETEKNDMMEEERRKSVDDLWSEIRGDDNSVEMPQVEKVSITLKPHELETNEVATQSTNTEAEAIALGPTASKFEVEEGKQIKVSTACGTSPDREIEEFLRNDANEKPISSMMREIPDRSSKVSIGTSPPPQSISTQVREIFF